VIVSRTQACMRRTGCSGRCSSKAGQWREVDWSQAIDYVAGALRGVQKQHGAAQIGALAAPGSTLKSCFCLVG